MNFDLRLLSQTGLNVIMTFMRILQTLTWWLKLVGKLIFESDSQHFGIVRRVGRHPEVSCFWRWTETQKYHKLFLQTAPLICCFFMFCHAAYIYSVAGVGESFFHFICLLFTSLFCISGFQKYFYILFLLLLKLQLRYNVIIRWSSVHPVSCSSSTGSSGVSLSLLFPTVGTLHISAFIRRWESRLSERGVDMNTTGVLLCWDREMKMIVIIMMYMCPLSPLHWLWRGFPSRKHISAWCWLCESAMQINQFDRKPSTLNFCAPGSTFIKKQWSGGLRSENWKSVWGFRLDGTCRSHFDFRFKHTTRQHCVSGSDQPSHLNKLLALTVKPLIHSGLTCHADISTAHVLSCHGEVGSRVKQSNPVGRIHLGSSSKQMFSIWSVFYFSLVKTLFFCPVSVASVTDGDGLTSHETAAKTCRCPEKKTTFNATETSPRWCTDVTVS